MSKLFPVDMQLDNTHVSHLTAFGARGNSLMRCWRLDSLCWRSMAQRLWKEKGLCQLGPCASSWLFAVKFTHVRWQFLVNVSWPFARFACQGWSRMRNILKCLPWLHSFIWVRSYKTNHQRLSSATLLAWTATQSSLREEFPPADDFLMKCWCMNPYIGMESEQKQILHEGLPDTLRNY